MLCHIHYVHVSGIEPKFSGMVKEYSPKIILDSIFGVGSNLIPQKNPLLSDWIECFDLLPFMRGRRGYDLMVVGFMTNYAISASHH